MCLPAGTTLWSGLPTSNEPGLFTAPDHVARSVGEDAHAWNLGLQIAPGAREPHKNVDRPENGEFVLAENTWVAHSTAHANPDYGPGGLEQYFVPQWQTNLTGPYAPVDMDYTDAVDPYRRP